MKLWIKYILSLSKKEQLLFLEILSQIEASNFSNLDMKKLSGFTTLYRIRIWGRRIVLEKNGQSYNIIRIGPRGDVYKNLSE